MEKGQYGLVTIHRSGNVDDRQNLTEILAGLGEIDFPLVFPIHPRTAKMIAEFELIIPENIIAIESIGYLDMLMLEKNADCLF